MSTAICDLSETSDMSKTTEDLVQVTERVNNHIKFFYWTVGALFACIAGLFWFMLDMNGTLSRIEGAMSPYLLEKTAEQPTEPSSQEEALELIAEAKRTNTPLPSKSVETAGQAFVLASEESPAAWKGRQRRSPS